VDSAGREPGASPLRFVDDPLGQQAKGPEWECLLCHVVLRELLLLLSLVVLMMG
jgi:hypothetical protein